MRQRVGNARQLFLDQLAERQFVLGIEERPEEADCHRLEVAFAELAQQVACGIFIQRGDDIAFGIDPLTHFEGMAARDVGRWVGLGEVIPVKFAALLQHEDVWKAVSRQECRLGDIACDNRIGGARRTVNKQRRLREQLLQRKVELDGCGPY